MLEVVRKRNQIGPLARRADVEEHAGHEMKKATTFIYDCKHFVLRFFLSSARV
jgi:hypothetical protein